MPAIPERVRRILWFVAIWACGVAALGLASLLLKLILA
ncbi:DUF2474 family protein [Minwuia thermotolerans]